MNKVITINLGGNAYQLEDGGYDALRSYLETAAARLKDNPDRDEILSDIEGAIAEKFRALLGSHKTVVVTKEVVAVLAELGPVEAGTEPDDAKPSGQAAGTGTDPKEPPPHPGPLPRRLYRIYDGAMISGVCNGIAAYVNVDPTFVRLAFAILTIFWGTGVLVYFVMVIVVPEASTPEEKAAASGSPATAQEFIRRAKEGYYDAMKNFPSGKAHRAWARQFRRDTRSWAKQWRYHWRWPGGWPAQPAGCHPRMAVTLPFLSLMNGVLTLLWVCALISLLDSGTVLGMKLPESIPVWLAAVLLFFVYGTLAGSLKAARRVCYWGLGQSSSGTSAILFLLDAAIWCVVVGALVILAIHFFPEVHDAVQSIPAQIHQASHDIHAWWNGK